MGNHYPFLPFAEMSVFFFYFIFQPVGFQGNLSLLGLGVFSWGVKQMDVLQIRFCQGQGMESGLDCSLAVWLFLFVCCAWCLCSRSQNVRFV